MKSKAIGVVGLLVVCAIGGASAKSANAQPTQPASPGLARTRITFIGSSVAVPSAKDDTACFVINDTFQVDCGWNSANGMRAFGLDPLKVRILYITHFHHDHYMGMPGLLFYRGMNRGALVGKPPIRIVGPAEDLANVVELSRKFLQADRFPEVWPEIELKPIEPGQTYETDEYLIQTIKARHPVSALSSRLTDKKTGAVIVFSGDTAPNPELAKLAAGADLLIHEASIGPKTPDDRMGKDHSRAIDAARIAREAGVKKLMLIHLPASQREASLAAAKGIFANTSVVTPGESIVIER